MSSGTKLISQNYMFATKTINIARGKRKSMSSATEQYSIFFYAKNVLKNFQRF